MPLVTRVSGDTTSDGRNVRLQVIVDDDEINELVLSRDDVQPFVTLLIALGGQALHRSGTPTDPPVSRARPFPVDAVTFGTDEQGADVLVFGVGATALAFTFEQGQMEALGRSLLTMSARAAGLSN